MRSQTIIPLLQIVKWMGLDPWRFAGIDYCAETDDCAPGSAMAKDNLEACYCTMQHAWSNNGHLSRDDIIEFLKVAEDTFVSESHIYPGDYFIDEESAPYSTNFNNAIAKTIYPSVDAEYSCYLQSFGAMSLGFVENLVVTKNDGANIIDDFSVQITLSNEIEMKDIRIFFTQNDGDYYEPPEFNDHLYEVRPFKRFIVTPNVGDPTLNDILIEIPAYLLKKPELDETEVCLCHVENTYVDNVDLFLNTKDVCDQGNFVCEGYPCDTAACEDSLYPLCFTSRTINDRKYGYPRPSECKEVDGVDTLVRNCLPCNPDQVEYNYLTGIPLTEGNYANREVVDVVAKLLLGLSSCLRGQSEWCCSSCTNKKIEFYKTTPKVIKSIDTASDQHDREWQVILTDATLTMLDGMPPNNGMIQALRWIKNKSCNRIGGTYI